MWQRKHEGAIQDLILQHAQKVLETVQALHEYINIVQQKKPEKRLAKTERAFGEKVLLLEKEADRVEEAINEELFRVAVLPVTSSDRFDLIASIDESLIAMN